MILLLYGLPTWAYFWFTSCTHWLLNLFLESLSQERTVTLVIFCTHYCGFTTVTSKGTETVQLKSLWDWDFLCIEEGPIGYTSLHPGPCTLTWYVVRLKALWRWRHSVNDVLCIWQCGIAQKLLSYSACYLQGKQKRWRKTSAVVSKSTVFKYMGSSPWRLLKTVGK